MVAKRYYAGGFRAVVDGVPIRLAREPSKRDLADLRAWVKYLNTPEPCRTKAEREERARNRVRDAREVIEQYAAALGISVKAAKARIEKQRLHNLANPVRDMSLEYDL